MKILCVNLTCSINNYTNCRNVTENKVFFLFLIYLTTTKNTFMVRSFPDYTGSMVRIIGQYYSVFPKRSHERLFIKYKFGCCYDLNYKVQVWLLL